MINSNVINKFIHQVKFLSIELACPKGPYINKLRSLMQVERRGSYVDDLGTVAIEIGCNDHKETTLLFSSLKIEGFFTKIEKI